jgi:hypothetical protein
VSGLRWSDCQARGGVRAELFLLEKSHLTAGAPPCDESRLISSKRDADDVTLIERVELAAA